MTTANGVPFVQQSPAQIFTGQPNQVVPNQVQQQVPQQIVVEQPMYQQQAQQVQQPQMQQVPNSPNYVNGNVSLDSQNFNLSEAGKELLNMFTNQNQQQAQQPQMMVPNGMMMVPQQQQSQSIFTPTPLKGLFAGAVLGGGAMYLAKSGGVSGSDAAALVSGAQEVASAGIGDIFEALFG